MKVNKYGYFTATFFFNTPSFTLALFPPPDLTFWPVKPSALSLLAFKLEGLAANFTRFSIAGTSAVMGSLTSFEDLRMVLISKGFWLCDFDFAGSESPDTGDGFNRVEPRETSVLEAERVGGEGGSSRSPEPKKSTATARAGFSFPLAGSLVDDFVNDPGSDILFVPLGDSVEVATSVSSDPFEGAETVFECLDIEAGEEERDFFAVVLVLFFFFPGSSSESRARFFPFLTSCSIFSGIDTRVKPSHRPPSSSSSPQLHIGRLALELVFMCID